MNPFRNPVFLLRIVKSYLNDIDRIWKIDSKQLEKYQNKALRKMVKYAYTVPIYYHRIRS